MTYSSESRMKIGDHLKFFLETNENINIIHQNPWDTGNTILRK
jgi:hypothetical protein